MNKIDDMMKARGKVYGNFKQGNDRIGAVWAAILNLSAPIPGEVVSLLMAAMKIVRAVQGNFHEDNYIDAQVYLEMAKRQGFDEECDEPEMEDKK